MSLSFTDQITVLSFFIKNGYFHDNIPTLLAMRTVCEKLCICIETMDEFWQKQLDEFSVENIEKMRKSIENVDRELIAIVDIDSKKTNHTTSSNEIGTKLLQHYECLSAIYQIILKDGNVKTPFEQYCLVQTIDCFINVGLQKQKKYHENKKYEIVNIDHILFYTFNNSSSYSEITSEAEVEVEPCVQNQSSISNQQKNTITFKLFENNETFCEFSMPVYYDIDSYIKSSDESRCFFDIKTNNLIDIEISEELYNSNSIFCHFGGTSGLMKAINYFVELDEKYTMKDIFKSENGIILNRLVTLVSKNSGKKLLVDWIGMAENYTVIEFRLLPKLTVAQFHSIFKECFISIYCKDFHDLYEKHRAFFDSTDLPDNMEEYRKTKHDMFEDKKRIVKLSKSNCRFPKDFKIIQSVCDSNGDEQMYWANNSEELFCLSGEHINTQIECKLYYKPCEMFCRIYDLKHVLIHVSTTNKRWDAEYYRMEKILTESASKKSTYSNNESESAEFESEMRNLYRLARQNNEILFTDAEKLLHKEMQKMFH